MSDEAATVTFRKPSTRDAVGLTIVLLLEVFVFMAAVFGIAISDAVASKQNAQTLAASRVVGLENLSIARIESDLAQVLADNRSFGRDQAFVNDAIESEKALEAERSALKDGGTVDSSRFGGVEGSTVTVDAIAGPPRLDLATIDSSLPALANALATLAKGGSAAERSAALGDAKTQVSSIAAASRSMFESVAQTTPDAAAGATWRNWLFRIAIVIVLAMIFTLIQRVTASRRQLEQYATTLEKRTAEAVASTRQLAEAKAGSDLIMETVDRGLFLLDRDYKIQGQYSRELERMFRMPELEGYNFVNLLQRLLTERTFEISRDYLALLFDKKKKERTVLRVNPLAEIEVHFANPAGGFDSKFLNFTFRRINDETGVAQVFVAVSDITDRVRLERQLRESEARKERQFEFLLGVLHVEPGSLDDFLRTANEQLAVMNDALRASDFATNTTGRMELLRQRLNIVYRAVHTIKGNASMLELSYFEKACDLFESKIVQLRERSALGGDDFLAVVIAQSELRQDIDELQDLRERFVGMGRLGGLRGSAAKPSASDATPDLVGGIAQFADQLADKMHKEVRVEATGFSVADLPDDLRRTVRDVLVQLTRNSVVHGLEAPTMRESIGKPRAGTLSIRPILDAPAGSFGFSFHDDGQGLDPALIRDRAVAKRIITPEQAAAMSDEALVALIFKPAFSTLEESTMDAGRGVGMNVIKEAIVDRSGGSLSMSSEPGRYTEFSFLLPLTPKREARPSENGVAMLAHT